jgi:hypothetical protein
LLCSGGEGEERERNGAEELTRERMNTRRPSASVGRRVLRSGVASRIASVDPIRFPPNGEGRANRPIGWPPLSNPPPPEQTPRIPC